MQRCTTLPNGFDVSYVALPEVGFLYGEIYEEQVYTQQRVRNKWRTF